MDKIDINNLAGKCIAALPSTEGYFAKSLIYICSHDSSGAMGLVVNSVFPELTFNNLAISFSPNNCLNSEIPLYQGGPLEREKGFILHDTSYNSTESLTISKDIKISSSRQIIQDIIQGQGPDNFLIVLGCCAWIPQQLETEISQNKWLITPASTELIFHIPTENRWNFALSSLGINNSNLNFPLGHS